MKLLCSKFLILFFLLFNGSLFAQESSQEVPVKMRLGFIKIHKSSEKRGDELYFSVTEYPSHERPKNYLIPTFPSHWLSQHLANVRDVELWSRTLKNNESVQVVISLMERDAPPWNIDDLIGTIKFKAKNSNGQIKKAWSIPNQKDQETHTDNTNQFKFYGENSEYQLELILEDSVKIKAAT
ncbi:MAG TPA: hypothetical protein VFP93_00885 [Gammaproteobacteria bacterium]|nr:hypothetical protein [Gammaproteobacteria bacterium]